MANKNEKAKVWSIIPEGENNAIITKLIRHENGVELQAETADVVWRWRISDKIIYQALVEKAIDAGWVAPAGDYNNLAKWIENKPVVIYHKDTKQAGPYRHRYYINYFVTESEAK